MQKKTISAIVVAAVIIACCMSLLAGRNFNQQNQIHQSNYSLPIAERRFLIGMVPTPKSVPETTFSDIADAYQEAASLGEVVMIWPSETGIGEFDQLNKSRVVEGARVYGLNLVITLNFATITKAEGAGLDYLIDAPPGVPADLSDPQFIDLWVAEAEAIAREFKPEYMSLGNEVNDYFYSHPDDFGAYLALLDKAYAAIKGVSQRTKVMVVLSYNHMIENDQFWMLAPLSNRTDLIGLTTYPWKQFGGPEELPEDYYLRIMNFTSQKLAFTEIGWTSSHEAGSSEKEQAEFLVQFLRMTKSLDIEMVNWLFLHEIKIEGTVVSIVDPGTASISLKNPDGSKKEVYYLWKDLKGLRIVR